MRPSEKQNIAHVRRILLTSNPEFFSEADRAEEHRLLQQWEAAECAGRYPEADLWRGKLWALIEDSVNASRLAAEAAIQKVAAAEEVGRIWQEEYPQAQNLGEVYALAGAERMDPLLNAAYPRDSVSFEIGRVSVTRAALDVLTAAGVTVASLRVRHARGDWGDVSPSERASNVIALSIGEQVSSVYPIGTATVEVITDGDRSGTFIQLPSDDEPHALNARLR
jgi:hypothetical protein